MKWEKNEKYFDIIDNENKSYFLGYLFADGNNYRKDSYKISLGLHEKDKHILDSFNQELKYNRPLQIVEKRKFIVNDKEYITNKQYRLIIFSKYMSNVLNDYGMIERKGSKLIFPNIPKEFINSFIRGYFDGDGYLGSYLPKGRITPKYRIYILSSYEFLDYLSKFIKSELNINSSIKLFNGYSKLFIGGNNQVKIFCDFIYKNSDLKLNRKYETYNKMLLDIKKRRKYGN